MTKLLAWLKGLYEIPVVKATLERMWRGGLVAVVSAYVGGKLVLDDLTLQSGVHLLGVVLTLFLTGALASLALALGISKVTKSGPALNKAEQIKTKKKG